MPDFFVNLILQSGQTKRAKIPDDRTVREIIEELIDLFNLPPVGPDGAPLSYELHSKKLGRKLNEDETLPSAGVPPEDRIRVLTANVPGSRS